MLKKRIGELFIVGFQGLQPSDEFLKFVEEWGIGGIIVFARNIDNPENLLSVIKRIEQASNKKVFAAIDQEGGLVMRILSGGSLFPSAMALAAIDDEKLTESVYNAIGNEMRTLGLNWNLAPVLDINHPDNPGIGARAFGDSARIVSKHGCAAIRGLQSAYILACAKHFPGKGAAKVDSHLTLPIMDTSEQEVENTGLIPFKKAIEQNVKAIMTAHVYFPAFEKCKNLPATLSESVLTGLLRKKLNFKGLLVTDDLEMGAITEKYGIAQAAMKSFAAGADQLLICHSLDKQKEAIELLFKNLQTQQQLFEKFELSLERIARAREFINVVSETSTLAKMRSKHENLIERSHNESIRCLKKSSQKLCRSDRILFVYPEMAALVQVEETHDQTGMKDILKGFFPESICVKYNPEDNSETILDKAQNAMEQNNCEILVFYSYNLHLFEGQNQAATILCRDFKQSVLIALRNPYDLADKDGFSTLIATFSFRTPAIRASLMALQGTIPLNNASWPINIQNW